MRRSYFLITLVGMVLQWWIVIPVSAGSPQGFYVGASAAYVWVDDVTYDLAGAAVIPHPTDFDEDFGWSIIGGYDFGKTRLELELSRRENDVDEFGRQGAVGPGKGNISADTAMLNLFYDFERGTKVIPYVGAGLGRASIEADLISGDVVLPQRTGVVYGDDDAFAFQLIAGINYQVSERLGLTLNYGYLQVRDAEFDYGTGCTPAGEQCIFESRLEEDYEAHTVSLGLRWAF